jgi:radical SAM protein with 4Fe4S-binding SPASM domain
MSELRIVFLELTKICNLSCVHCKAEAGEPPPGELTKREIFELVDSLLSLSSPLLILTGGEPLMREDVFDIASYATGNGFRVALATNGTLIDDRMAGEIRRSGIKRVSVSLDGSNPKVHDGIRGVEGAFEEATSGIENLKSHGVEVQINTTVTKQNVDDLPAIMDLCLKLQLKALHLFLLVPVGCGLEIEERSQLSPVQYERVLNWLYRRSKEVDLELKATCAPHYFRIADPGLKRRLGCLAGVSVCFISSLGHVQPCGYLPLTAGNIRERGIKEIWENAEVFRLLRDSELLRGKCGICEFKYVCGGCRARAYARTGDFLDEEPQCVYIPSRRRSGL